MNSGIPPPGLLPAAQEIGKKRKGGDAAPRKRAKKAAGSDDAAAADGAAPGGSSGATPPPRKPPTGRRGGAAAGRGRSKADKVDDDLLNQLVEKEEGKVDEEQEEKLGKTHSGVFGKDLPWLMYGYGDAEQPFKETVDLVEDIAVQFITDTVHSAMAVAASRNPSGASTTSARQREDLRLEDLLFAVRRYPRQVARIQELIRRQQEIKDARKMMDMDGPGEEMPAQ